MSKSFKTEQEHFWAGEFGDSYVDRNNDPSSIANRISRYVKIISRTRNVGSVLEFGTNTGQNLLAIKSLIPQAQFGAVEINKKAAENLQLIPDTQVWHGSIFDFEPEILGQYDLTMTSGVLIHIEPKQLQEVYRRLYECSIKYILLVEYYNPTPVEIIYRGHAQRLFKRDFAGEMLDSYTDLELIDYGFQYYRDPNFPADDCTWFLLQK